MRKPELDIVIVNWNAGKFLRRCVDSIEKTDRGNFRLSNVFIVDNASSDGSADGIESEVLNITVIKNERNLGYAAAANQGGFVGKGDYVLFLNPDVELFENSLSVAIEFMEKKDYERVGIAGIKLLDENGRVWRSCVRFPTFRSFCVRSLGLDKIAPRFFRSYFMTDWAHDETRFVDHVIGAFFLVRRTLFESLNGFDERFFVYFEDLDFSLRASKSNWKTVYIAETSAFHKGGGTSEKVKDIRLFYSLKSRLLYASKHFKKPFIVLVYLCTLLLEPIAREVFNLLRGSISDFGETFKAYLMLWKDLLYFGKKESAGQ